MAPDKAHTRVNSMVVIRTDRKEYITHTINAQELARVGLEVLVRELGTEGARLYLRDEFAKYLRDYRGDGRDERPIRLDEKDLNGIYASAHGHGSHS